MNNLYYSHISTMAVSAITTFILFGDSNSLKKILSKIFIPKNRKDSGPFSFKVGVINHGILKYDGTIYDEVILTLHQESKYFPYIEHCTINAHGSIGIIRALKQLFEKLGAKEVTTCGLLEYLFKNHKINYLEKELFIEMFKTTSFKYLHLLEEEKRMNFLEIIKSNIQNLEEGKKVIEELIEKYKVILRFKKPVKVGIFGPANAGKSTLFNTLTATSRAIVSAVAGTTRDYLSHIVNFKDFSIEFIDTAGVFESSDFVDMNAGEITKKIWNKPGIIKIVVTSCDAPLPADWENNGKFDENTILVYNKIDKYPDSDIPFPTSASIIKISALKNINIDLLIEKIKQKIAVDDFLNLNNPVIFTRRQYILLNKMLHIIHKGGEKGELELLIKEIQDGPSS